MKHSTFNALAPRLRSVVAAIATGRPAKQLAGELGISYASFCTYRKMAYAQLGVHSAVEAANAVTGNIEQRTANTERRIKIHARSVVAANR